MKKTVFAVLFYAAVSAAFAGTETTDRGTVVMSGQLEAVRSAKADKTELAPIAADAGNAIAYSKATYDYMQGNTNAYFSGTNYVIGAANADRTHFAFEDGMDFSTVPCSMALWETRDGVKQCVWDQRDWTVWYWNFKIRQYGEEVAKTNAAIYAAIAQRAFPAWSKYTSMEGLPNPDTTTTWVNTKNLTLAAGYSWQSVVEVGGCGYWTIFGDNAVIGGSDNAASTLVIRDFEGNPVLRITKGDKKLVYLDTNDFISGGQQDGQGRVTFLLRSSERPVGEYSVVCDTDTFIEEGADGCPADYEWEQVDSGTWRIHFIAKPGINATACFARFKVQAGSETKVVLGAAQEISGGIIYNGVKIAPSVIGNEAVGTVIQWKVVR